MIDFNSLFKDATIAGVPLLLFVIALVQEIKQDANLSGPVVRIVALVTGLALGLGYQLATAPAPNTFAGWFTAIVFGLLLGLAASRLYDAGTTMIEAARPAPVNVKGPQPK